MILALNAGVPVEDVRRIVGHGDAETTLDNYYNPEKKHAAERVRRQMRGTVLDSDGASHRKRIAATTTALPATSIDDVIATLTEKQRKALARRLLGL